MAKVKLTKGEHTFVLEDEVQIRAFEKAGWLRVGGNIKDPNAEKPPKPEPEKPPESEKQAEDEDWGNETYKPEKPPKNGPKA